MKKLKYLFLCAAMLTMTSCAEMFETIVQFIEELESVSITDVRLSRRQADMLVGDSLIFSVTLDPDTAEVSYKWTLSDPETQVVRMIGKRLYARQRGQVTVYVEALPTGMGSADIHPDSIKSDSCIIHVMEYNEVSSREFPYEMIFIANLEVADTLVTDSVQASRLVAIVDGEVRGRAVMRTAYGIPYLEIRIGSKTAYGEQISFEYYNHSHYLRHEFPAVTFDGETHGTLSDPVIFRVNEPADIKAYAIDHGVMMISRL